MNGTRSDTDWKSSIVRLMPTECAMAIRCKTAFVEPPRIIVSTCSHDEIGEVFQKVFAIRTIAFSNAALVIISRGRMFLSTRFLKAGPTESHSSHFSLYSAGNEESPGSVIPSASAALAIVFAVYIWKIGIKAVKIWSHPADVPLHKHQDPGRRDEQCCNAPSLPPPCDRPGGISHTTGTLKQHQAVVLPRKIRAE